MGTVPTLKGTSLHSFGGKNDDLFVSFLYIYFYCNHDSFRDLFFFFFFFFFFNLPVNFTNAAAREDAAQ